MSGLKPFHKALERAKIPSLTEMSYHQAQEKYDRKVCYEALRIMGYTHEESAAATAREEGSARERLFRITGERH